MPNKTALGLLIAASALMATGAPANADLPSGELEGGYQEWTTDQDLDAEATKDAKLKKTEAEAEDEGVCIPIGEGENCW